MAKKEKAPATPLQIAVSNALSEMGKLHVEMAKEYAHDITDDNRMALEEHATRMLDLRQWWTQRGES